MAASASELWMVRSGWSLLTASPVLTETLVTWPETGNTTFDTLFGVVEKLEMV